jgi:hypothetical protein
MSAATVAQLLQDSSVVGSSQKQSARLSRLIQSARLS